jgi:hypothetical protein
MLHVTALAASRYGSFADECYVGIRSAKTASRTIEPWFIFS